MIQNYLKPTEYDKNSILILAIVTKPRLNYICWIESADISVFENV